MSFSHSNSHGSHLYNWAVELEVLLKRLELTTRWDDTKSRVILTATMIDYFPITAHLKVFYSSYNTYFRFLMNDTLCIFCCCGVSKKQVSSYILAVIKRYWITRPLYSHLKPKMHFVHPEEFPLLERLQFYCWLIQSIDTVVSLKNAK